MPHRRGDAGVLRSVKVVGLSVCCRFQQGQSSPQNGGGRSFSDLLGALPGVSIGFVSPGRLAPKSNRGVSLQGSLSIRDGELRFDGGNVYPVARYDIRTGKCLNKVREEWH